MLLKISENPDLSIQKDSITMGKKIINKCKNGHFFINNKYCPICKEPKKEQIDYNVGDCVDCGMLCPGYAYGCNQPNPIPSEEDKNNPS